MLYLWTCVPNATCMTQRISNLSTQFILHVLRSNFKHGANYTDSFQAKSRERCVMVCASSQLPDLVWNIPNCNLADASICWPQLWNISCQVIPTNRVIEKGSRSTLAPGLLHHLLQATTYSCICLSVICVFLNVAYATLSELYIYIFNLSALSRSFNIT